MSRTMESPVLKRRPVHDVSRQPQRTSPRNTLHSPDKPSDEDLEEESVVEINDMLEVDDGGGIIKPKMGLYPDLNEFKSEDARYVYKRDEHGTLVAGEYSKTTVKTKYKTGPDFPDSVSTKSESSLFKKILYFCIVLVFVALGIPYFIDSGVKPVRPAPPRVIEIVNTLRKEHTNQPSLSFRIIKKALESVLALKNVSEPAAPAVLMLMSTKGAEYETVSFAKQLAELVASGNRNYQTIYGNELQSEDPDKAKKEIDDLIKGAPQYNKQIVVLITDLDVIPSKAVMMLHAYCDHENAPFKNAVFIMTISTDADINNCESRHFDEAAESHLTSVWGDLSKDMLSALLSRITVSVAAIYHKTKPALCR